MNLRAILKNGPDLLVALSVSRSQFQSKTILGFMLELVITILIYNVGLAAKRPVCSCRKLLLDDNWADHFQAAPYGCGAPQVPE